MDRHSGLATIFDRYFWKSWDGSQLFLLGSSISLSVKFYVYLIVKPGLSVAGNDTFSASTDATG